MTKKKTGSPPAASATHHSGIRAFFMNKAVRETVESVVIALVLAFLFRTFEAEAFVIPTGSMADTLKGQHKDVICQQCGYPHQVGDSDHGHPSPAIVAGTCPMCRYSNQYDLSNGDYASFTGDRILVSKFIYDFHEPDRWDVIVFKYPDNAKQNYIKRLVGKPNETIKIWRGDVYIKRDGDDTFRMERKPPYKLKAMLQEVYDTEHVSRQLTKVGWPQRWQNLQGDAWQTTNEDVDPVVARRTFQLANPPADRPAWLAYRHLLPTRDDWSQVLEGILPSDVPDRQGELITDFYGYNSGEVRPPTYNAANYFESVDENLGLHWVGDLALEANVKVESESGELLLEIVEAGRHLKCAINVADGVARLSIDDGATPFVSGDGKSTSDHPLGQTPVKGPGSYSLRFSNADNELLLWVNDRVIPFDGPTTYEGEPQETPQWSPEDPGDAAPVRIGGQGVKLAVSRLRLFRDIYYIAEDSEYSKNPLTDYDPFSDPALHDRNAPPPTFGEKIHSVLRNPATWSLTNMFDARRAVEFKLEEDQFFPMGDNSPASKDARIWGSEHYVERRFLTGKALFIYWPHAKRHPFPFTPNFERMGFVR